MALICVCLKSKVYYMPGDSANKPGRGGARPGAGRKKMADARVRKTVFLHQSEWELLESKCQEGETISGALCRILGQAVTQKQSDAKLEALKRRHKPKAVAKVQSVQGNITELSQRHIDFMADHLGQLFVNLKSVIGHCEPGSREMKEYYQQAMALEMLLTSLDDHIFTERLAGLKMPKGVDVEGITDGLLGY